MNCCFIKMGAFVPTEFLLNFYQMTQRLGQRRNKSLNDSFVWNNSYENYVKPKCHSGEQIKKTDDIGRACRTYGGEERFIQSSGGKT